MIWHKKPRRPNAKMPRVIRIRDIELESVTRPGLNNDAFRHGWNTALASVVRCLPELAEKLGLSAPAQEALAVVGVMSEAMMIPVKVRPLRNRALAKKYRVSVRTVSNWRSQGCPFEQGQGAVVKWVAARRYAPAGMEAKYGNRLLSLRVRRYHAEVMEGFAERRRLKLLRKLYGLAPDPDDKRLRCPKGGLSDPKALALKQLIEAGCDGSNG